MSKRIDYNNDNKIAAADRATIKPNAAPNAAPAVAKSTKMSVTTLVISIVLIVLAALAITLLVINLVVNSYVNRVVTPSFESVNIEENLKQSIADKNAELALEMNPEGYDAIREKVLMNYAEASHQIKSSEDVYNFAVYGINKFSDNTNDDGVATFVMIASFNNETKKVTYSVIKETVLVYIPVRGIVGGLKDAYAWGGSPLLTKTIQHNFGLAINGYIEIDMTVAAQLVDNAGGLEVTGANGTKINDAIESYNKNFKTEIAKATVENNKATLDGMQTVAYLRADYADSNNVIKALGDTIFQSGFSGIKESVNIVLDGTKLSVERDDFIAVGKMAVSMLKKAESTVVNVCNELEVLSFNLANNRVYYSADMEAEREALISAIYDAPKATK